MIEIRTVKLADEVDQLIELYSQVFKSKSNVKSWEWKYVQHPLSSFMPEVVVALDGNKIVGARPFMLNELWLGNKKVIAAQHCDTMVHPDYRRQGIFNRMGAYAAGYLAEHGCALSYGFPVPMSRKGFISQGYRKIMDIEVMFRLVNPLEMIICRLRTRQTAYTAGDYSVEISAMYIKELDLLDSLRNPCFIDMVRSEPNLRWRFDSNPRNKYLYLVAKKEGRLKGYAVISRQRQKTGIAAGLAAGIIIDYLVKDNNAECFSALISAAMQEFSRSACQVVKTWTCGDPELRQTLIQRFGFKSSGMPPYNRYISGVYMDALAVDKSIAGELDIYDSSNWRVTYAFPNYA